MSVLSAILYSAFLIAASAAHQVSSTPPQIAQTSSNHLLEKKQEVKEPGSGEKKEALHEGQGIGKGALLAIASTRRIAWAIVVFEVSVRLLSLRPAGRLSAAILPLVIPSLRNSIGIQAEPRSWMIPTLTSQPSFTFYLSLFSIGIGFAIRMSCFRTMGRHFSFLHTTLEGHTLISSGPYSIVRHPSYTGEILVRFGMLAVLLRSDGILAAAGVLPWFASSDAGFNQLQWGVESAAQLIARSVFVGLLRISIAFYAGWIAFACPYLLLRAPKEDATLRETFGKEWDEYAARVPWRFLPYIA